MQIATTSTASIGISRGKALTRGVVWFAAGGISALATYAIYSRLEFVPSAISNRLVDYSAAILALPLPIAGFIALVRAARWWALALWPDVGIQADQNGLTFHLGPFGRRRFDARQMEIRYPFELLEEAGYEPGVEAYLPEDEQLATLLPRIRYPGFGQNLNEVILKFALEEEAEVAKRLSPVIASWRSLAEVQTLT